MSRNKLIDEVLEVSQDYLGPAAERFIHRQITTHLNKNPQELTKKDLLNLIDWLKLSFALITDDGHLVEEYAAQLNQIAQERQ